MNAGLKWLWCSVVAVVLVACQPKSIRLQAQDTPYAGILTQSIQFTRKGTTHQWVCYTELQGQQITGISCQNDTALPVFSGGLVEGEFVYDYPSRLLIKLPPQLLLGYIKMSLYKNLSYNQQHFLVTKQQGTTQIQDLKRKINLTISML